MRLTGSAPTVTRHIVEQVPSATLTLTGIAPGANKGLTDSPASGTLTLTGTAPTVTRNIREQVPSVTLTLTGTAPTNIRNIREQVGSGTLTLTGTAPTEQVTSGQTESPASGTLTLTGTAPTVTRTIVEQIPSATLRLVGTQPDAINSAAAPAAAPAAPQGGGKSRWSQYKRKRVKINGRLYEVENEWQVRKLLEQAMAEAEMALEREEQKPVTTTRKQRIRLLKTRITRAQTRIETISQALQDEEELLIIMLAA